MAEYTTEITINGEVQFTGKLTKTEIIKLHEAIATITNDEW